MRERNVVLIGGTGTGKAHLSIAIARAAIRKVARQPSCPLPTTTLAGFEAAWAGVLFVTVRFRPRGCGVWRARFRRCSSLVPMFSDQVFEGFDTEVGEAGRGVCVFAGAADADAAVFGLQLDAGL